MDLILDILISKNDVNKLNIEEMLVEWGDETFSRNPKEFRFQSSVFFQECENEDYYKKIIGKEIDQYNFMALTLQGENLMDLEFMVNRNDDYNSEDSEIVSLIYELYKTLDTFCIILLLNEEQIDERYLLNDVEQAVDIFSKSLNWESPKGIIISKGL